MKKFFRWNLLFLFVFFTETIAFDLHTADFCLREGDTRCQSGYFPCSKQYCSMKKKSCKKLINTTSKLNMLAYQSILIGHIKILQLSHFMQSIKLCHQQKKFNPNEACSFSNLKCYVKKRIPTRAGETYYYKVSKCKCDGHFKQTCGNNFCTVNNHACVALAREISENSTSLLKIKYCKINTHKL